MKVNHIKFNNETSIRYGLRLNLSDYQRVSPQDRVEQISIDGVDGVHLMDLESIDGVTMSIPFHIYDVEKAEHLTRWLRKSKGYQDLELSWDADYIYKASFFERYDLETLLVKHGKVVLNFLAKPWKYLKSGLTETTSLSLINPSPYESKPIYIITATGDVVVTVNGEELKLKGLSGTTTIDTEREVVTGSGSFSNVLTYPFPRLKSGENTISISNGTLKIIPMWRERL